MTDAEWLEEIRAWASVTRLEDDDGPTFFLLNRGDRLEAEVERLRGVARRAYDAFSLSAQYTDEERFLAMKALGLALGLVDPDAQAEMEAKP